MNNEEWQSKLKKLPKWVQDHIKRLEYERDEANRILLQFAEDQKPSKISYTEFRALDPKTGNRWVKKYVHSNYVTIEHDGIKLDILIPGGVQDRHGIEISWSSVHGRDRICMEPYGHQQIRLKNMGDTERGKKWAT